MPKLTCDASYKNSHIHLLLWPSTTSDGFVPSLDQLKDNIMPKLAGYSCYKNLYINTLP